MFNSKKLVALSLVLLLSLTAMAAPKQVIVLSVAGGGQAPITVQYVLWVVPSAAQPIAGATSSWSGASPAENAAIAAGTVVEIAGQITVSATTSKAAIQTQLAALFTAAQAQITANPPPSKATFSGCFFDGTVWSC